MSMDALSYQLPVAGTQVRRRFRRPPRPNWRLLWVAYDLVFMVVADRQHEYVYSALFASWALIDWHLATTPVAARRKWHVIKAVTGFTVVALDVAGVIR